MSEIPSRDKTSPGTPPHDEASHLGNRGMLMNCPINYDNVENSGRSNPSSDVLKTSADEDAATFVPSHEISSNPRQRISLGSIVEPVTRSSNDLLDKSTSSLQPISPLKLQNTAGGSGPSLQTSGEPLWMVKTSDTHRPRALQYDVKTVSSYQGNTGVLLLSSSCGPLSRYTRHRSASVDLGRVEDYRYIWDLEDPRQPTSWKINPDYWDDGWTCGPQYHVVGCDCKQGELCFDTTSSCFEKSLGKSSRVYSDGAAARAAGECITSSDGTLCIEESKQQITTTHSDLHRKYSHDSMMAHRSQQQVYKQSNYVADHHKSIQQEFTNFPPQNTADSVVIENNTPSSNRHHHDCDSPPHATNTGHPNNLDLEWSSSTSSSSDAQDVVKADEEEKKTKSDEPTAVSSVVDMITGDDAKSSSTAGESSAKRSPQHEQETLSNATDLHPCNNIISDACITSSQDGRDGETNLHATTTTDLNSPAPVENNIPVQEQQLLNQDSTDKHRNIIIAGGSLCSHGDSTATCTTTSSRKQGQAPGKGSLLQQELSHIVGDPDWDRDIRSANTNSSISSSTSANNDIAHRTLECLHTEGTTCRKCRSGTNTSSGSLTTKDHHQEGPSERRLQRSNTCPTLDLRNSIERTRAKLAGNSSGASAAGGKTLVSHHVDSSQENQPKHTRTQSAGSPLSGNLTSLGKPFKPLAVARLAKVSRKNLQSFDDLSPMSSRSTSRRSSLSSSGALEPRDLQALEKEFNEAMRKAISKPTKGLSSPVLSDHDVTSPTLYRKEFSYPGQSLRAVSEEHLGDLAESEKASVEMANTTSPGSNSVFSESEGTKMSIRVDFSNLRLGRPTLEGLKSPSSETRAFTKRSSSESRLPITVDLTAPMSAPVSPVRTLQDLTTKMRGRTFNYAEVQIITPPPMSPENSEMGDDEGCVLSEPHEVEINTATTTTTPRRTRKLHSGKFVPDVPQILLKNKEDLEREGSAKFTLKANLRPLNNKQRTTDVTISGGGTQTHRLTGSGATHIELKSEKVTVPITPSSVRRRKKYAVGGQSSFDSASGGRNLETNGRSRSDPTQERKRSVSDIDNESGIDAQMCGQLRGSKSSLTRSSLGSTSSGMSTESTLSISSVATSISDTTSDPMYITEQGGVINNNIDMVIEKAGKALKKKSLTWPNGDKSPNEPVDYTQVLQISNSEPTVSNRQDQLTKIKEGSRFGDDAIVDSNSDLSDNRPNASTPSPQVVRRKPPQKRNRGGSGEALERELKSAEKLRRQGSLSDTHSKGTTSLVPNNKTDHQGASGKHGRSRSVGPTNHAPERKAAVRKKPIIPTPEKGNLLRPVLQQQTQLSESTPDLNLRPPHRSMTTDALISPTRSKAPPGNQVNCATLPRAAAKKDADLSPGSKRRIRQLVSEFILKVECKSLFWQNLVMASLQWPLNMDTKSNFVVLLLLMKYRLLERMETVLYLYKMLLCF